MPDEVTPSANKTSQAVEIFKNGMHLKSFSVESVAIAAKYKRMEEALQHVVNSYDYHGEADLAAVEAALAFDPLSSNDK